MTTEEARTDHEDVYEPAPVAEAQPGESDPSPPREPIPPREPDPPRAHRPGAALSGAALPEKVPMTAALLSVVPGLGNIYNGLYARGIAFFLIQFALLRVAVATQRDEDLALIIPSLMFFWLFNLFDAHRQAMLINAGGGDRVGRALRRSEAGGLLFPGLVLVGIGTIGALNRYAQIDVWQVFDHWPALILLAGIALVARGVIARRESSDPYA